MKYTILTIDPAMRQNSIGSIRRAMVNDEEIFVECVRGLDAGQLLANKNRYGFRHNDPEWRPGEAGLWYSNINAWNYAAQNGPLMVFEDDALPLPVFRPCVESALSKVSGYDFISFYTPYRHPHQMLNFKLTMHNQEHGNICILYSQRGAQKILDLLGDEGLQWPVDIWLFKKAIAGDLVGLSPHMHSKVIIEHDWSVPTTIHEDERVKS